MVLFKKWILYSNIFATKWTKGHILQVFLPDFTYLASFRIEPFRKCILISIPALEAKFRWTPYTIYMQECCKFLLGNKQL